MHSPHLLLLSGVGPARELGPAGVAVQVDLPGVGANFHDHPVVPLNYTCAAPVSLYAAESIGNVAKYLLARRGMLATGGAEALAHLDSTAGWGSRGGAPDLQLLMVNALWCNEGLTPPPGHGFAIAAAALKPNSRGRIALRSPDPRIAPLIDPNYLADPEDREVLRRAVRLARELAATPAFAALGARLQDDDAALLATGSIDALLSRRVQSYYHPVGSCRMGRDPMAVVDRELRVRGVDCLRVIDASVMPSVPRANTNAATVAVAERGADLLLGRALLASAPTVVATHRMAAA